MNESNADSLSSKNTETQIENQVPGNWLKQIYVPSRSLSNVSAVIHSVAGPVPFTVMADTLKEYSVPRSRPERQHSDE